MTLADGISEPVLLSVVCILLAVDCAVTVDGVRPVETEVVLPVSVVGTVMKVL